MKLYFSIRNKIQTETQNWKSRNPFIATVLLQHLGLVLLSFPHCHCLQLYQPQQLHPRQSKLLPLVSTRVYHSRESEESIILMILKTKSFSYNQPFQCLLCYQSYPGGKLKFLHLDPCSKVSFP